MDVAASQRNHGVTVDDMTHALVHHWRALETDDKPVRMFIGPSTSAVPVGVGVIIDADRTAIVRAMPARGKVLAGWWTS